jgi:hypothetical protein
MAQKKHSLLKFLIQQKDVAQNGCWKDYNKYSETWQEWWLEVTKQQLNTTFPKQLNYLTLLPQASAHEMPHANHVKRGSQVMAIMPCIILHVHTFLNVNCFKRLTITTDAHNVSLLILTLNTEHTHLLIMKGNFESLFQIREVEVKFHWIEDCANMNTKLTL